MEKEYKEKISGSTWRTMRMLWYNKCNEALELHHIDRDTKKLSFGKVIANPKKWAIILEEAKKCVLLCSNCHKEVHFGYCELPTIIPKFKEPNSIIYKKDMVDSCPVCGSDKPLIRNTCSYQCATKIRGQINWDDEKIKTMLLNKKSWNSIANEFSCSDVSVSKRSKKMGYSELYCYRQHK